MNKLSKETSIAPATLHGWANGRNPNLADLKKIANVLEVSLHELVFGETDPFEAKGQEILKELFSGDVRVTLHRIERKR